MKNSKNPTSQKSPETVVSDSIKRTDPLKKYEDLFKDKEGCTVQRQEGGVLLVMRSAISNQHKRITDSLVFIHSNEEVKVSYTGFGVIHNVSNAHPDDALAAFSAAEASFLHKD